MDEAAILARARKLAEKAKPGFENIGGKLYTFEFDQNEWVYRVYEDGFLLVSFNTKSLTKAKRELRDWLAS
jgi:hypothetical protein